MPSLKWSRPSIHDLTRLHGFLASGNPDAARRAMEAVRQGVKVLGKHPEIGRLVEELPHTYREWVIDFGQGAYLVLYRYSGNEVIILAVRHGREAGY